MRWESWGLLGFGLLGLLTWRQSGKKYFEAMGSALGMQSARPAQIVFLVVSLAFIAFGFLALTGMIDLAT